MKNQRQPARFKSILKQILTVFLVLTFILTGGSFILRHTITKKLDRLSSELRQPWQQPAINRLLVDLNVTENSFQQASANGKVQDLAAYKKHLRDIFIKMDAIIKGYKADTNNLIPKSKQQIGIALRHKLAVSQQLFDLQKRFTSLLEKTTVKSIDDQSYQQSLQRKNLQTDTSVATYKEPSKRSLIKRLKDAVTNTSKVKVLTIKQEKERQAANLNANQNNLVKQLGQQYELLNQSNQELILANLNLLTELRQLVLELQGVERIAFENSREKILEDYRTTSQDLNIFTGIATAFILLFIILLLIFIRKASQAEMKYIVENGRAVKLAGQKSEILAIMSHEIRNKLMAINGAVFMLKRTDLLPEQEKKVASINLSSFLLLETVNNVLDVSKLEQNDQELQISPFSPFEAISDSVEAMRFMAEKKGIDLNFDFDGAKDYIVNGDGLRLKQVLLNLLSNSIKYTDQGHVNLSAKLEEKVDSVLLRVNIADTGSGIPKGKQAKLFSPYYQAGGQKPGTGLGLYLCRQLVTLQKGTISLESEAGQGCTVRFVIPY